MTRECRAPRKSEQRRQHNERGFISLRALGAVFTAAGVVFVGCSVGNAFKESGTDGKARLGAAAFTDESGDVLEDVSDLAPPLAVIADATGETANDQIDRRVVPWIAGTNGDGESQDSSSGGTDNGVPLTQLAEGSTPTEAAGTPQAAVETGTWVTTDYSGDPIICGESQDGAYIPGDAVRFQTDLAKQAPGDGWADSIDSTSEALGTKPAPNSCKLVRG